jgi:protein-S-isoprenylcysteine O-methyltransferase Ste14
MRKIKISQKLNKKVIAVVAGVGLVSAGAALAYWQSMQQQWCVRFTSSGGQEVTYSRGCYSPQRYKKWVITASAVNGNSQHQKTE